MIRFVLLLLVFAFLLAAVIVPDRPGVAVFVFSLAAMVLLYGIIARDDVE